MAENNTLLEKLDGLVSRFEEVSTLITDPNVIADQKRYVKLTKEYKELGDLMAARKEYLQCLNGLEEAKMMMAESDPEMKEMAREEAAACEARIPALEEEIKLLLVPATRKMTATPFWKFVAVQAATKQLSLQEICSVCIPSTANAKAGSWKYLVPTKEQLAVSRKLFVPLPEIKYTVP